MIQSDPVKSLDQLIITFKEWVSKTSLNLPIHDKANSQSKGNHILTMLGH